VAPPTTVWRSIAAYACKSCGTETDTHTPDCERAQATHETVLDLQYFVASLTLRTSKNKRPVTEINTPILRVLIVRVFSEESIGELNSVELRQVADGIKAALDLRQFRFLFV
jgi:hypothetical protein